MASEAEPRDLATLAEVRELLGLRGDQVAHNDTLQRWIGTASELIYKTTGREFISQAATFVNPVDPTAGIVTPTETRVITLGPGQGYIRVGDLQELTSARYRSSAALAYADVPTSTFGLWQLLPTMRDAARIPARRIYLGGAIYTAGTALEITGKWGWPQVPAAVRDACVNQVKIWYDRRIAKSTETELSADGAGAPATRERRLAGEVYDMVIGYRDVGPLFA